MTRMPRRDRATTFPYAHICAQESKARMQFLTGPSLFISSVYLFLTEGPFCAGLFLVPPAAGRVGREGPDRRQQVAPTLGE